MPFFIILQFLRTLTNFCNIWHTLYTELIFGTQQLFTYLPASPLYCCYTTLGKQIDCIVITLVTKVIHYHCTKFLKIRFIHATGVHLSLNIKASVNKMSSFIHTGLECLSPFTSSTICLVFTTRVNQAPCQVGYILNWHLIHSIWHRAPYSIFSWIEIRTVRQP